PGDGLAVDDLTGRLESERPVERRGAPESLDPAREQFGGAGVDGMRSNGLDGALPDAATLMPSVDHQAPQPRHRVMLGAVGHHEKADEIAVGLDGAIPR